MSDLFPSNHSRNSLLSAQKLAAERAVIRDDFAPIKLIAGADQAFAGDMMLSASLCWITLRLKSWNAFFRLIR
jgi:deoxyinosine 3'endonuclease (endonuclease V)